jgi:hypothetical protein
LKKNIGRSVLGCLISTLLSSPSFALEAKTFTFLRGSAPVILSAPHGGYDLKSEVVARRIAGLLNASFASAVGFRTDQHPINVNRPTEGVHLKSSEERETEQARAVFRDYVNGLDKLGKADLYVEIHASIRPQSARAIEMAECGFSKTEIESLKKSYRGPFPILMEPVDPIYFHAEGAKKWGTLAKYPRCLHFELPSGLYEREANMEESAQSISQLIRSLEAEKRKEEP